MNQIAINKISIPARAYMNCVKQWALSRGIKFFTWEQQRKALANYEIFAAIKN